MLIRSTQTTLFLIGLLIVSFACNIRSSEGTASIQDQLKSLRINLENIRQTNPETKREQYSTLSQLYNITKKYGVDLEKAKQVLENLPLLEEFAKENNVSGAKALQLLPLTQRLNRAASTGDINTLRMLVAQGADINATDPTYDSLTPLMVATKNNQWGVVYALVKKIDFPPTMNLEINKNGGHDDRSALGYAAQMGYDQIVSILLNAEDIDINTPKDSPPLIEAISFGHTKIANMLLDAGAKLDLQHSGDEGTALIRAIQMKDIPMAKRLIQLGANIYITDEEGNDALYYARKYGLTDIVNELSHFVDIAL